MWMAEVCRENTILRSSDLAGITGDGTYSIIDGKKSFSALKELGAKNVPVIVVSEPYQK